MMSQTLREEIEKHLKDKMVSIAPLSAANNAQIDRVTLSSGRTVVAKVAEKGLDTEAFMLGYLKQKSKLPVPEIYYSNEHVIVMSYVEGQTAVDDMAQRHGAELVAELHGITSDNYGFDRDTTIGGLLQPNAKSKDWGYFFIEHRLLHMAREAMKEGKLDAKFMKQLEKMAVKFTGMIKDAKVPSLLHGDIWSGNVLSARGKILAFLDPAVYYGEPEIELAFIRLFNTFNSAFFARYSEIRPIKPGFFEERADVYALYPLLVHARLFGASYVRKAQKILERFA